MSLLAEVVVEEWLNRQGYFTIRGIRLGVDEIDLLAIRPDGKGSYDCRHVEVQVSMKPVSYICHLPREVQRATGRAANTARRDAGELQQGVLEWVAKKFDKPTKAALRERLAPGSWSRELVINKVKSDEEVTLISQAGVRIVHFPDVIRDLEQARMPIASASGADLLGLVFEVSRATNETADSPNASEANGPFHDCDLVETA